MSIAAPILFGIAAIAQVYGQSFEVASIKPSPADGRVDFQNKGGRITAASLTLKSLLVMAYGVRSDQITGGPGWIGSDRFDINAKTEVPMDRIPEDQLRAMLQALLKERFQLKVHHESERRTVYALVVGKNGPKFQPSSELTRSMRGLMGPGRVQFTLKKATLEALARRLISAVGHPVVDKTDLKGEYDFTLEWTPEGAPPSDSNLPSVFTAVQEQLGLRLDAQKGDVEYLVIDHVEKLSVN